MAIRVLARPSFHRILLESTRTHRYPVQKIQSSSQSSLPTGKLLPESSGNPRFAHQVSLAKLLQRYGFPSSQIPDFLNKNCFLLSSTSSDVEKCIGILLSFGLSQKSLVSILSSYPRALNLGFIEKWKLVFSELGASAVPPSLVFEQCARFQIEPDNLRRTVMAMRNLGWGNATVSRVFEALPAAFTGDPIDLGRRVEFLKVAAGVKNDDINRICHSYSEFLAFGVEGRLRPLFEEFRELGFDRNEVRKVLLKDPQLLLGMETGELSRCMRLLKSLKCRVPIKERILSNGPLMAGIDVKLRVDCLCQHGLIRRDAFKVLFVEPRSILYGLEDIEKKIDFLLHKIGFSIECLVEFPEYLGMNLDKQIIPRHDVIEYLRLNGGLGFEVGLKHLVRLSRLRFYNLYVKPYPECEMIFGGPVREAAIKPRHPAGLWKLFKPQSFPDTKEDVRNMKLFMESL